MAAMSGSKARPMAACAPACTCRAEKKYSADISLHREIDPVGAFDRVGGDRAFGILRLHVAAAPLPNGDPIDDGHPGADRRPLPPFGLRLDCLENVAAGGCRGPRLGECHRQIAKLRLLAVRDNQNPADKDGFGVGGMPNCVTFSGIHSPAGGVVSAFVEFTKIAG